MANIGDSVKKVFKPIEHPWRFFTGDRVLWIIVVALSVISVLVVYSSTAKMAYASYGSGSTAHFLRQQLLIIAGCFVIMMVVQRINSRTYKWLTPLAFVLSLILTFAVYFVGSSTNGAARWIDLGFMQLQPSEALKVCTILFLARQLARKQSSIATQRIIPTWRVWRWFKDKEQKQILRQGFCPILLPILIASMVILPAHTSSAVLLFGVSLVMMFIGRVNIKELLKIVGYACIGVMLLGTLNMGRSETAKGRVGTWVEFWTDSTNVKPVEHLSDTERSMIAIHNGGLIGKGAGQSAMRVEMIHPESDYAYAFFVEEYGFIMASVVLMLYLWIFFRAIVISRKCGTAFPILMVLGLALMITCQALLHVMVTVNLIPETGQTLPLISRGGSSMLFTSIALGMILSVSRQNDEHSHDTPKDESMLER